jgi:hypothetical protein
MNPYQLTYSEKVARESTRVALETIVKEALIKITTDFIGEGIDPADTFHRYAVCYDLADYLLNKADILDHVLTLDPRRREDE